MNVFWNTARPLALKKVLNFAMHTARIPPVDPTPATINAVLSMHAGHIFPRFLSLLRISKREGYAMRKIYLSYVMRVFGEPGVEHLSRVAFKTGPAWANYLAEQFFRPVSAILAISHFPFV